MNKWVFLLALIAIHLHGSYIFAHDDKVVHPEITAKAAKNSLLEEYLKNNLNFENGFETKLPSDGGNTVLYFLQEGSRQEDSPMCRASNHFHDPTKPWNSAGLTDAPGWVNAWCFFWQPYYSTVTWATGYTSPTETPITYDESNAKSPNIWGNARKNYYAALSAPTKDARERSFAQTFLAVGMVAHLLQDMSIPAHVRNDFDSHWGICKGEKCSAALSKWRSDNFELYVKKNSDMVLQAGLVRPYFVNLRLTDFWDTNQYNGYNPSGSAILGLAEYTNQNYFSDSTIRNNPSSPFIFYPEVKFENAQICEDYEPGSAVKRKYISRTTKGACPALSENRIADHFATPSLLNEESDMTNQNISTLKLWLDDNVHNTYAQELLPMAIGYSAEVLNYFFRGQLDFEMDEGNITIKNISKETLAETGGTANTFSFFCDNEKGERKLLADKIQANTLAPDGSFAGVSKQSINYLQCCDVPALPGNPSGISYTLV